MNGWNTPKAEGPGSAPTPLLLGSLASPAAGAWSGQPGCRVTVQVPLPLTLKSSAPDHVASVTATPPVSVSWNVPVKVGVRKPIKAENDAVNVRGAANRSAPVAAA